MKLFRRRADDDFAREIEAHVALETDRLIAEGMSAEEARHAARRRFGNATHVRERFYESRRLGWLADLRTDVRHAWRALRRAPGFAAVAVATLSLGIGANTAIFSVVNAVLLRPLPFVDAERLVRPVQPLPGGQRADGRPPTRSLEPGDYERLRDGARTLSHVVGVLPSTPTVTGLGEAIRLDGIHIAADAFDMLAAAPLLGRTLRPRDEGRGADNVIVLSHAAWLRHFGGEPTAVGRTIAVDGRPTTIVGVMPREFTFPEPRVEFWMPYLPTAPDAFAQPIPVVIAKLNEGVSIEAAEAEVGAILRGSGSEPRRFTLRSLHDDLVAPVKPALLVLAAAVGLLLLIACVNVAHLVLARTALRQPEIAVRLAIGASRGRLVRQMLTENVVLAGIGGVAGIALAFGGLDLLRVLAANLARVDVGPGVNLPRLEEISVDLATLTFTVAISVITAVLFGFAPAIQALKSPLTSTLRRDASRHRFRELLVAGETAMAMVLLVGGGLLIHSFVKLLARDAGYEPSQVLTFQAAPERATPPRARAFSSDLLARLESLPGVRAAGYDNTLPLIRMRFARDVSSRPIAEEERLPGPRPQMHTISRGLLPALGIRIVEGRTFSGGDAGRREALVNQAFVRSGILGPDALGRRLYSSTQGPWDVVGVVNDVLQSGLDDEAPPQIYVLDFVPPPPGSGGTYFAVRTAGEAQALLPTVRALAREVDSNATISNVATMDDLMWHSLARQRLYAVMMGIFAAVSAALAAIGIFGVVAFAVAQRTREIGIRMALGAQPRLVLQLVMRETAMMTAIGMTIGVAAAAMLSRYLQGLLFGVTTLDPGTFAASIALFAIVATVAAYAPATRATTLDPVAALRTE
jgi:putative ABC transport system permease protein